MFYTDDTFFFIQNHQGAVFQQINQWLARSRFRCLGFSSARQLLEGIDQIGPAASVAVFGPVLQDMSGLQLTSQLRREAPDVSTVMVLRSCDIRTATQALLSGNQRLIFDDCDPAETLTLLGEATLVAKENHLKQQQQRAIINRLERLTADQLLLLQYWCQGFGSRRLLQRLGGDEGMLREQKRQIRAKLEIDRVVQLLWEVNRLEIDIDSLLMSVRPRGDQTLRCPSQAEPLKLRGEGGSPATAGQGTADRTAPASKPLRTAI